MGRKSLGFQFCEVISMNFKTGLQKHSISLDPNANKLNYVFSFQEKKNLCDISKRFARYCKSNYNIKYIKEIKIEHAQSFLNSLKDNCTASSLKSYTSYLRKVSILAQNRYKTTHNFGKDLTTPISSKTPLKHDSMLVYRSIKMEPNHYFDLQEYLNSRNSLSKYCCALSYEFGLRNRESCSLLRSNVIFYNEPHHGVYGELNVKGKGGRWRKLFIEKISQKVLLEELCSNSTTPNSKLIELKPDSASAGIRRALKALGLEKYTQHKSNQHSIRKLHSTLYFLEKKEKFISKGFSIEIAEKKARQLTMVQLGHSANRESLFHVYVLLD